MAGYRAERIAVLIHKEVARRLREEVKDPRMVPISITQVKVTRDLSRATLSVMPMGGGKISVELQEALDDLARQLRGPIGRNLRIRRAPELVFVPDTHTEEAIRMTQLLNRIGDELREADGTESHEDEAESIDEEVSSDDAQSSEAEEVSTDEGSATDEPASIDQVPSGASAPPTDFASEGEE